MKFHKDSSSISMNNFASKYVSKVDDFRLQPVSNEAESFLNKRLKRKERKKVTRQSRN